MIALVYMAVDDDDLQDAARHLPLRKIQLKHLGPYALKRAALYDIVVLHRADGKRVLKNTFDESEVEA